MDEDAYVRWKERTSAFAGQMRDNLPKGAAEDERPYAPRHPGIDEEATRRAQATAERARETAAARGEHADAAYVEEGPEEAARRTGRSAEEVGEAVERAAKRARRR